MKGETEKYLLNLVRRNYNEIAAEFDITRKKALWPEMERLAKDVRDGASILDAGCGNGRLLDAFIDKKIDYLGIDNSEELIRLAKSNYPDKKFGILDILDLNSLPDQSFDYVFCLAVLQHIPGQNLRLEVLHELGAKLKSSGRLIISVWNLWQSPKHRPLLLKNYWFKILGQSNLDFGDILFPWKGVGGPENSERYYHAFTDRELKKLIGKAGLKIEMIKDDKHNYWLIVKK